MKNRIAIRMPNWIGDAIMATPVIEYAKIIFPQSHLLIITKQWTAPIFQNNPNIDELLLLPNNISKKPFSFIKIAKKLRRNKIDYYITLPNSLGTAIFGFLSGAKKRIGYKKEGRSLFLTHSITLENKNFHRTEKYLHLFFQIKPIKIQLQTKIYAPQDISDNLKLILKKYNLDKGFIGINPNSMASSRRWGQTNFANLIRQLPDYKLPVVLFGSKKETAYVKEINKKANNNAIDLSGQISLSEYITILQFCRLFITNDSGPMHIAFALHIPTIALEGPADIKETGNYNTPNKTIYINKNVDCSPCVLNNCPKKGEEYKKCMKAIHESDVLHAISKLLPI